jgi:hypothetical protein
MTMRSVVLKEKKMNTLDPRTGEYLWRCPECGEIIRLSGPTALCLVQRAGRCQGCRARATFKQNPGLTAFFLDFWARADAWPQSDSWMTAIPNCGVPVLRKPDARTRGLPGRADWAASCAA